MATDVKAGLFAGVDLKIDELLGIPDDRKKYGQAPRFKHRAAAERLSKDDRCFKTDEFMCDVYELVEGNWRRSPRTPSPKLWVPRMTWSWSPKHRAFEVPLERNVASLSRLQSLISREEGVPYPMWFNQIPVAAGLVAKEDGSNAGEGKNCVDLICRKGKALYDFVELKFSRSEDTGDTVLGAAMEILKYSAAYLFVVANRTELEKRGWTPKISDDYLNDDERPDAHNSTKNFATATELLEATGITLCVLAPRSLYAPFQLECLSTEINSGLSRFIASRRLGRLVNLQFRFEYFGELFEVQRDGGNGFKFDFTRHLVPPRWADLRAG